ncbi:hypothetical protein DVH24_035476 [Malus domestica]|uniref:Uncharacterized protein n=1 Tax=Malus domestica TaxID=3750 RepID=A0A498JA72_MALDO|nr:hypothetical protein DVH24_035476 [Malus domestica]
MWPLDDEKFVTVLWFGWNTVIDWRYVVDSCRVSWVMVSNEQQIVRSLEMGYGLQPTLRCLRALGLTTRAGPLPRTRLGSIASTRWDWLLGLSATVHGPVPRGRAHAGTASEVAIPFLAQESKKERHKANTANHIVPLVGGGVHVWKKNMHSTVL